MMNFSTLLSEALRQGDLHPVEQVDPWLLTDIEVQGRSWALNQRQQHGVPPTFDMLAAHPDHRVLATAQYAGTNLRLLFGNTMDYLKRRRMEQELSGFSEQAELEGAYPLGPLTQVLQRLKSVSRLEHDNLVDADLDSIFAQKALVKGLNFGFEAIDSAIGALLPGDVALLAARTGVGKSAVVCHVAPRWALHGKKVLLVSCEMPASQLLQRMYGMLGGFNPKLFRQHGSAAALDVVKGRTRAAIGDIAMAGGDIVFPRDRSLTLGALDSAIAEEQPDVVIVDGVYLLRASAETTANWENTKAASNRLKQMALEYEIPFFTTSQFKRADKEDGWTLEDLAYSDALGQDADIVFAASHDSTCHTSHRLIMEVIKNRGAEMGARAQIDVDWNHGKVTETPWTTTTIKLHGKPTP